MKCPAVNGPKRPFTAVRDVFLSVFGTDGRGLQDHFREFCGRRAGAIGGEAVSRCRSATLSRKAASNGKVGGWGRVAAIAVAEGRVDRGGVCVDHSGRGGGSPPSPVPGMGDRVGSCPPESCRLTVGGVLSDPHSPGDRPPRVHAEEVEGRLPGLETGRRAVDRRVAAPSRVAVSPLPL